MQSLNSIDRGCVFFAKSSFTIVKMWDARRKKEQEDTPKFWKVKGILAGIEDRCRRESETSRRQGIEEICKTLVDGASLTVERSIDTLKGEIMSNIESMIMSKRQAG